MGNERTLDERKQRFCELYLSTFNGTESYLGAGYTAKSRRVAESCASKLLRTAIIQEHLASLTAKVRASAQVTLEEVVIELHRILTSDMADALDEHGAMLPLKKWPLHLRRALAALETEEITIESPVIGEPNKVVGQVRKFKLWSKTEAGQQLMRHLGGFLEDNKQQAESIADIVAATMEKRGEK